jgi:HK97 family phage major capsid protein
MPQMAADAKTVLFGDFSYYWIADRQGRTFKRLNELYAVTGQVGFLGSQRVDAKIVSAGSHQDAQTGQQITEGGWQHGSNTGRS